MTELKLLAASFASGLARASQRQSANAFGLRAPEVTLGNSVREGAANVADRWADRILDDILTEGYYVRVPAGTQFYIYATQTIEPDLASLGGLKQSQRAVTSHDLARAKYDELREPADEAEPEGVNPADTRAILRQRETQMETAKLYLEAAEEARREEERRERIRSGEEPEGPPPPPERTHLPRTNSNPYQLPQANGR